MNAATKSPSKTIILTVILIAPAIGGCGTVGKWFGKSKPRQPTSAPAPRRHARTPVPDPINRLLPKTINIHPFTGTRTFDKADRIKGVDVRIEVLNHFGEPTKAFGDFRFEIYRFRDNSLEPKDKLMDVWEIEPSMLKPRNNLRHWNRSQQMYEFKLQWDTHMPEGRKFVLAVVFTSPFTKRMTVQRVFTSGE
jgi:hypothetical protein